MQEAIVDQVRAVEFDMESTPAAEVGSLLGRCGRRAPSGFERIADEDERTGAAAKRSGSQGPRQKSAKAKEARRIDGQMPKRGCRQTSRSENKAV